MSQYDSLKVWLDGKMVGYSEATVPILTHSMQYGSGIFEGIRAYPLPDGSAGIFRLSDHMERFVNTARIYGMNLRYTKEELEDAVMEVVAANGLSSCYIRPFAFYNDDRIGLSVKDKKVSVYIAAVPLGNYFSDKNSGIRCRTSSWHRISSSVLPVQAKASGNYLNSIIANSEARRSGFDEAILTSPPEGYLAEGPGENIFLVKKGKVLTPGDESDILIGITRDTVMTIARDLGYEVVARQIHREELYIADEAFFCGTAAEITPIVEVDGIRIGQGRPGNVTSRITEALYRAVRGGDTVHREWITSVSIAEKVSGSQRS